MGLLTHPISEVCGWLGAGCAVLGAASLANSPLIPDEIPVAVDCTAIGIVCAFDFIIDTYGDAICDNPSFAVYEAAWWMSGPDYVLIPRC